MKISFKYNGDFEKTKPNFSLTGKEFLHQKKDQLYRSETLVRDNCSFGCKKL